MRTKEIVAGKKYTNGKQVRKVLELGEFKLYDSQSDTDCVRYIVVERFVKGNGARVGTEGQMTRNSFAQWATSEYTA